MSETLTPPPEVTRAEFRKWRDARRGKKPAEDLTNPYWAWLIRSEESSWSANEHFRGPSSYGGKPAWSVQRFGQSTTLLPDGRTVLVAGEHEDHYDPDFFIYNDVILRHPDGGITILGYPADVFPPTDFHSATLVDGKLLLIGNLGYPEQRQVGETQILVLDPATWEIRKQESSGEGPGWIHRHEAVLEEDGSIRVSGGEVWTAGEAGLISNFDDWRLRPESWTWERLTRRNVTVLEFLRADGEPNRLFEMGMWIFRQDHDLPAMDEATKVLNLDLDPAMAAEMDESMKGVAPRDRDAFERLYRPDELEYQVLPDPEDSLDKRIEVAGVRVRYAEDMYSVRLTIEGELSAEIVAGLRDDLKAKLERAGGVAYEVRQLRP